MVRDDTLVIAIVAIYESFCVSELRRHWLTPNGAIQASEMRLHVRYALTAYRTTVRRF